MFIIVLYPLLWGLGFFVGLFLPIPEKKKPPVESGFVPVNRAVIELIKQQL